MNHLGTRTLTTDRLVLRRFRTDDARMMYDNWASDPEVTRYLTWQPHENVAATAQLLARWTAQYDDPTVYLWAITCKQGGDVPIGSISVVKRDDDVDMVQVGYCIGRAWWGQGIMTEALRALIAYLFDEVKANRIEAIYDPRNPGSGKVMQKCGMRYEGTMRESHRNNQGICDACMHAILAKDR